MADERERISELVGELQKGNQSVFEELYKLTSSRAYFVAFEITKNEQDAEDILQESYIKMLEKIGSLDKPESFVSWFHHIVANKSKDSLKKKKPDLFEDSEDEAFEVIPDEDTSFSPEENLNQEELHRVVMEAIDELTEEKRACVMMMYFEEMSVNEISESLEIPVSTVKNRVFTARKDLKAKFEKRGITSLYSLAPMGVVVWALTRASQTITQNFAESVASARVLSGITLSGAAGAAAVTASTATAGTAATVATTAAATTATTAATGGGAAAATGLAALSVAQKVIAGVVAVCVVSGSAVGIKALVDSRNDTEETTIVEEVTTAPETTAVQAIVISTTEPVSESSTEQSTAVVSTTANTTKPSSTATTKVTTTKVTTATTTKKPTTTTTTKKATTTTTKKPTTTTTTKATTTTTKETTTTTKATTTTTTEATTTTTTAPAPATVNIQIINMDDSIADTLSFEVEPGTTLTWENVMELAFSKGYDPEAGLGADDPLDAVAESGKSYMFHAYLGE